MKQILQLITNKLDKTIYNSTVIQPLDLIYSLTSVNLEQTVMTLKTDIVFPFINLKFRPIGPMKIVSTHLSR
jgi:hypothetical protein